MGQTTRSEQRDLTLLKTLPEKPLAPKEHVCKAIRGWQDRSLMATIQRCACGAERSSAWERPGWGSWA